MQRRNMSTNFHIIDANGEKSSPVGRRNAAGYYCDNCHKSTPGINRCPFCGKETHLATSFTFAMSLQDIRYYLSTRGMFVKCVMASNGETYTYPQFMAVIKKCSIHVTDMIGKKFE
jgi:hypothetical protein